MKITVVGTGYVGMSISVLLALDHDVIALDIDQEKVNTINNGYSTIADIGVQTYLNEKKLSLVATTDKLEALFGAEFILVTVPTDYDEKTGYFDTSIVENVIRDCVSINPSALIIIKSTVPVGFTKKICKEFSTESIIFSPEFLREGSALFDNLHPSRIIVGGKDTRRKNFARLLEKASANSEVEVLLMSSCEAEAVKLFSNTYLAMRISFFNELDSYALTKRLDVRPIIKGVSLDQRIGDFYNNPSFGYGGYCLPKDTKQLLKNYKGVPQNIIQAIVSANITRKKFITKIIIEKNPSIVGVYRLAMKLSSDNFRSSAVIEIIKWLRKEGIQLIIYEPLFDKKRYLKCEIFHDIEAFIKKSDVILANRLEPELDLVSDKVFTRDLFSRD